MRILDEKLSRYSLQRWVAFIGGTGALAVAVLNFVSVVSAESMSVPAVLATPGVSFILILGGLFFATSVADSRVLRTVQVFAFLLGGVATAVGSSPGNITSALFAIYAIVLVNEYANENSRLIPSSLIGISYMIVFALTAQPDTAQPAFYLVSASVFTGQIIFLFALVTHRQTMIRKEYATSLESMVHERTGELRVAVNERDQIIRELHHRVGNSLQLLSSYVRLQRDRTETSPEQILKLTELRIHSIAAVHATLHNHGQLTDVPLRDYTTERLADIAYSYESTVTVRGHIETRLDANIDFLLPFGIVLTELLAAMAGNEEGKSREKMVIDASLVDSPNGVVLSLEHEHMDTSQHDEPDDGSMFAAELIEQLGGTIERAPRPGGPGTRVEVRFPVPRGNSPQGSDSSTAPDAE